MALTTFGGLKTAVAAWIKHSGLTSVMPELLALTEARIARDLRIRKQVTNAALSTVAGTQTVTLPGDFLEIENIGISSSSPPRQLHVVTPELMDERYPAAFFTGVPVVYALLGDVIQLGPTPDAVYTVSLDYYQRFTGLSDDTDTNWLLTNYPGVYLFGMLTEAAVYTLDDERTKLFEARYQAEVQSLQTKDDESLRSGSAMRVRTL